MQIAFRPMLCSGGVEGNRQAPAVRWRGTRRFRARLACHADHRGSAPPERGKRHVPASGASALGRGYFWNFDANGAIFAINVASRGQIKKSATDHGCFGMFFICFDKTSLLSYEIIKIASMHRAGSKRVRHLWRTRGTYSAHGLRQTSGSVARCIECGAKWLSVVSFFLSLCGLFFEMKYHK